MRGSAREPSGKQPDAKYSQEFPTTPAEREQARIAGSKVAATKPAKADPRDTAAPYNGTTFQGTEDPSRFSTPPPAKP